MAMMSVNLKSVEEIEGMRVAGRLASELLDYLTPHVKPGITTADVVKLWPKAEEFGFANEEAAFALQYGHGVGLSIWSSRCAMLR